MNTTCFAIGHTDHTEQPDFLFRNDEKIEILSIISNGGKPENEGYG